MHKLDRTILTLKKREATLRTLIAQSASDYHLYKAADKVRLAKIQVLRATIGSTPSVLFPIKETKLQAKLSRQIDALVAMTAEEILAEFRSVDS